MCRQARPATSRWHSGVSIYIPRNKSSPAHMTFATCSSTDGWGQRGFPAVHVARVRREQVMWSHTGPGGRKGKKICTEVTSAQSCLRFSPRGHGADRTSPDGGSGQRELERPSPELIWAVGRKRDGRQGRRRPRYKCPPRPARRSSLASGDSSSTSTASSSPFSPQTPEKKSSVGTSGIPLALARNLELGCGDGLRQLVGMLLPGRGNWSRAPRRRRRRRRRHRCSPGDAGGYWHDVPHRHDLAPARHRRWVPVVAPRVRHLARQRRSRRLERQRRRRPWAAAAPGGGHEAADAQGPLDRGGR